MSQNVRVRAYRDLNGLTVEHWQDCEPVMELNKTLRDQPQRADWGRQVYNIPLTVELKWLHEEWNRGNRSLKLHSKEWSELVEKKMRDPEWRAFRVDR